jgi:uncharacterized membrane protein
MNDAEGDRPARRWDTSRIETFSDGVFAIAITLLVLDIRVPSGLGHLKDALEHEWPAYLAYVTSFLTIGGVWITHHTIYSALRYVDATMMRINLLLLMVTAFLPFPTAILAEALRAPPDAAETAVVLYGATALVIELLLQASVRHADSTHDRAPVRPSEVREGAASHLRGSWTSTTIILYGSTTVFGAVLDVPKLATAAYLALAVRGALIFGGEGSAWRMTRRKREPLG